MVLPDPAPAIEIIVRGVCLSRGHLLVCRNVSRGNVYLPGGHVEWGESSPSALRREWREELGADCAPGRFLGVLEQRFGDTCEIGLYFLCDCPTFDAAEPVPSAEPHIAFDWLPLSALPASPLLPAALPALLSAWLAAPPPPVSAHHASNLP